MDKQEKPKFGFDTLPVISGSPPKSRQEINQMTQQIVNNIKQDSTLLSEITKQSSYIVVPGSIPNLYLIDLDKSNNIIVDVAGSSTGSAIDIAFGTFEKMNPGQAGQVYNIWLRVRRNDLGATYNFGTFGSNLYATMLAPPSLNGSATADVWDKLELFIPAKGKMANTYLFLRTVFQGLTTPIFNL